MMLTPLLPKNPYLNQPHAKRYSTNGCPRYKFVSTSEKIKTKLRESANPTLHPASFGTNLAILYRRQIAVLCSSQIMSLTKADSDKGTRAAAATGRPPPVGGK